MEERRVRTPDRSTIGSVLLERVGPDQYRVVEDPLLTEYFRLDDIIEARPEPDGALRFDRVVRKGPWRTLVFGLGESMTESDELKQMLRDFADSGGKWDRVFGGMLYLFVPRGPRSDATRQLIRFLRASRRASPGRR